jgi:hypothetical protein
LLILNGVIKMKLTAENIQFIDNYLKNSEVIYYDIRMEMLDHVATAVEQKMQSENLDFYDAFKSYMVVNKREILKGNKLWPGFSKDIISNFLKFLFQPIMILIGVLRGVYHKRGHYEMVEKTGLYWHFVDLVWVFVFTFFYLV